MKMMEIVHTLDSRWMSEMKIVLRLADSVSPLERSFTVRALIKLSYICSNCSMSCTVDWLKINAPSLNPTPLSETIPSYMTMAFPTLFPDGTGDFYQPRLQKVDLGGYFKHLHYYGGRFAQHRRFPWFALNSVQRARTHSRSNIFVKQQHDALQLTATDIRTLLSENDETIVCQMMRYGTKLRGTRAYWAIVGRNSWISYA